MQFNVISKCNNICKVLSVMYIQLFMYRKTMVYSLLIHKTFIKSFN